MALMEAMATGLPVITTRIAGIPELVEDGVSGLVVPPGREDALRAALQQLASDRPLAARLGAEAVRRVRERHDPARSAQLLEGLLVHPLVRGPEAGQ